MLAIVIVLQVVIIFALWAVGSHLEALISDQRTNPAPDADEVAEAVTRHASGPIAAEVVKRLTRPTSDF